jgi:hypothetical protein
LDIKSQFYYSDGQLSDQQADWVAKSRLDIIQNKVKASLEHANNDLIGSSKATKNTVLAQGNSKSGTIVFEIKQKEFLPDGRKPRPLKDLFDTNIKGQNPYETFVKRAAQMKKKNEKK